MRAIAHSASRRGLAALLPLSWASLVGLVALSLAPLVSLASLAGCAAPRGTIGAVIAQDNDSGRLFLRDVPPGLAAAKAGLKSGDEILLIDGRDVRTMNSHQIHDVLSGDVDDTVKLTVVRGEQVLRVTLRRTEARKLMNKPANAE